jgi:hypothetical protein
MVKGAEEGPEGGLWSADLGVAKLRYRALVGLGGLLA